MALLQLTDICVSYGGPPVLSGVNLTVEPGERIALVGRNGEGKSTLLKTVLGVLTVDSGQRRVADGAHIAYLDQEVPQQIDGSVYDVVSEGLGEVGGLVKQYHHLTLELGTATADQQERLMTRLGQVGEALEAADGWGASSRVESVLTRMALRPDDVVADLSSGMKRRVLLARALVSQPALLLLDEPTNHLDIEAIQWLEKFLAGFGAALLFITHDRVFLQDLATRIVELDRGNITSWPGDYAKYLTGKAQQLAAEESENALFDKRLAQEETWIRQGIKARRTRNEGRVRALKKMRDARSRRRNRQGSVKMSVDAGNRSGELVFEAKGAGFSHGNGKRIIRGLSTTILRGDRVGIIGPNGAGKSTLLKLLLGELEPTEGSLRRGTNLTVAYFDQLRATLNPKDTVREAVVAGGSEQLQIGDRTRHVMSYLRDFLFAPERTRVRVEKLSGGERNRLLLARLFTRSANLLVLDEPTNDLDADTLEILEALLTDYPGTLLVVSHDRAFLDNVVTSTLVFEGDAQVKEYLGGYGDWLRQRSLVATQTPSAGEAGKSSDATSQTGSDKGRKKLSYQEKQELAELPKQIEALEQEQQRLALDMANPSLHANHANARVTGERLAEVEKALAAVYGRWEALEDG